MLGDEVEDRVSVSEKKSRKKHSPRRELTQKRPSLPTRQPNKQPSRPPSPPREPFDLFANKSILSMKTKRNKKPGAQCVTGRIIAKNAKNMHLTVSKKDRTTAQNKERKTAKQFDVALRSHPANDAKIGTLIASSLHIPESQISDWEMSESCCSQDLLGLCSNLLSLEVVEEDGSEKDE